jgi:hypothetical protein
VIDWPAVDEHLAGCLAVEPGDDAQERRFAATGRAEQNREAPIRNLQRDVAQHGLVTEMILKWRAVPVQPQRLLQNNSVHRMFKKAIQQGRTKHVD